MRIQEVLSTLQDQALTIHLQESTLPWPSLSSTPVQGQYQKGPLDGLTTVCLQAAKACNSTVTSPHTQALQLSARQQGLLGWVLHSSRELLSCCKGSAENKGA